MYLFYFDVILLLSTKAFSEVVKLGGGGGGFHEGGPCYVLSLEMPICFLSSEPT